MNFELFQVRTCIAQLGPRHGCGRGRGGSDDDEPWLRCATFRSYGEQRVNHDVHFLGLVPRLYQRDKAWERGYGYPARAAPCHCRRW